ncbi:hypothetical protein H696_04954 [Fonticula alba]|uniref:ABC transporter domain-containing protein n=1 Tax=Fonticula alba TaxID=691883 RepID=A0A058Z407_FONAL|nr:hypothetical protein H696_04954 [Fonticula alba]KCV68663.1 hypothetical protein H696_04954 [Fonticula alba]|eukprot:XP_009497095.1 hypothetical protein H696_04954 [Fonticula alba]
MSENTFPDEGITQTTTPPSSSPQLSADSPDMSSAESESLPDLSKPETPVKPEKLTLSTSHLSPGGPRRGSHPNASPARRASAAGPSPGPMDIEMGNRLSSKRPSIVSHTSVNSSNSGISSAPSRRSSILVPLSSMMDMDDSYSQPIQSVNLTWSGIVHRVNVRTGPIFRKKTVEKTILDDVSGQALPGRLLAIMGPSGGGKTSLLDSISGRLRTRAGTVLVNGKPIPRHFRSVSSYVMQDDLLVETLTPRELLTFAARLRLSPKLTARDIAEHVNNLLNRLSLTRSADTRVGKPEGKQRGLSGGERKRTAIAYEMITNPSLLFLDEPTTGLDAFMALQLIELLKALAAEGRTIVTTIHQPSSDIFGLFDDLLLLSGGKVAYLDEGHFAVQYFADLGYVCPNFSNPSDFFMKILHSQSESDAFRVRSITDSYLKQSQTREALRSPVDVPQLKISQPQRASPMMEFITLFKRSTLMYQRNPVTLGARLGQTISTALMCGLFFYKLDLTQAGASGRSGSLFFLTSSLVMSSCMTYVLTFPMETRYLMRDKLSEMYSTSAYYWAKFFSELPWTMMFPVIFALIAYFMVNLHLTVEKFFIHLLGLWLVTSLSTSMGIAIGSMFEHAEVAVTVAPTSIVPLMVFGGFFAQADRMLVWLNWIQYISPHKWTFQALMINEFRGRLLTCAPNEFIQTPSGPVCPITTGEQFIESFGMKPTTRVMWKSLWMLAILFISLRLIAWFFLVLRTRRLTRTRTQ